jgi:hypothetical protein
MKKILLVLATLSVLFIGGLPLATIAAQAPAVDPSNTTKQVCEATGNTSPACNQGSDNPISGSNGIILKVVQLILIGAGVISVLMIMLGGWAYVTSQGDPQKLKGAKDTILYAIIGLVIAGSAQAIISFVFKRI